MAKLERRTTVTVVPGQLRQGTDHVAPLFNSHNTQAGIVATEQSAIVAYIFITTMPTEGNHPLRETDRADCVE